MTPKKKPKAKNLLPLFKAMQEVNPIIDFRIEKVIDKKTVLVTLVS